MPQRSGTPEQVYAIGGEGVVLWMAPGDAIEDAVDYNVLQWSGNLTVSDQPVTNTSDFNAATNLMNDRTLITGRRLEFTANYHFNADPGRDILAAYVNETVYPHVILYVTRGNLAGAGVTATNRCYFDVPEVFIGQIAIEGGEVAGVRAVNISGRTNGVFQYVSEPVPVGGAPVQGAPLRQDGDPEAETQAAPARQAAPQAVPARQAPAPAAPANVAA